MTINVGVTGIAPNNTESRDPDYENYLSLGDALEFFARMSDDSTTRGMFCFSCQDDRIVVSYGNPHHLPSDSPFSVSAFVPGGLYYIFTPGYENDWPLFQRVVLPLIAARPGFYLPQVRDYLDARRIVHC